MTKLFLDTANLEDIERGLSLGILSGITTNPALLAKEPKGNFIEHMKKIVALCKQYDQIIPLSVEVFSMDPKEMIKQAEDIVSELQYRETNIKIPIGWQELGVVSELTKRGIPVNVTCGFNTAQAILAANAGARYFSLFCGRMKDIDVDPFPVISETRELLEGTNTEIIIGSIRHMKDIVDSFSAGAHIVTAPLDLFEKMSVHPKSTESVNGFLKEFNAWMQ